MYGVPPRRGVARNSAQKSGYALTFDNRPSSTLRNFAAVGATWNPGTTAGRASRLTSVRFVYVDDVDDVIARVVELGAKLQRPAQDQFYGDRDGYIIDPFGHGWTIASHVEDAEPAEMMQRMAQMQGHQS